MTVMFTILQYLVLVVMLTYTLSIHLPGHRCKTPLSGGGGGIEEGTPCPETDNVK